MGDCDTEQAIYWIFVCLSLLLTYRVAIYRRTLRNLVDNPAHGTKRYLAVVIVEIIAGFTFLTALYPLECVGFESFLFVVLIRIYLLFLAFVLSGSRYRHEFYNSRVFGNAPMTATSTKEIV